MVAHIDYPKQSEEAMKTLCSLPEGIEKSDLERPRWTWKNRNKASCIVVKEFELCRVEEWGWCIATLLICHPGRRHSQVAHEGGSRTYAVRVATGETVRIGLGPHVKERAIVYVRKNRVKALQRYLTLLESGAVEANTIRDRISTRRAQTALRRGFYW